MAWFESRKIFHDCKESNYEPVLGFWETKRNFVEIFSMKKKCHTLSNFVLEIIILSAGKSLFNTLITFSPLKLKFS